MDSYHKFENDTVDILSGCNGDVGSKTKPHKNKFQPQQNNHLEPVSLDGGSPQRQSQRLRLTAVETEVEYFLKVLRVSAIKKLLIAQVIAAVIILLCQVTLYAIVTTGYYKPVDASGIGIWGPLLIFSVASGLTLLAIKSPTGCLMGTAMAFQITSALFGCILTFLASISLVMHGRLSFHDDSYDPEVGGRVACSFMILASVGFVLSCIFISIQFCRATCCGRYRGTESIMFDAEVIKT